jgi:hypothetical protein
MKIRIILGVLLILIFLPVCKENSPPWPSTNLQIEGEVTDLESGQPIENATVSLHKWLWDGQEDLASTGTNSEGYYHIAYEFMEYCDSSTKFIIRAAKEGYYQFSKLTGPHEDAPRCTEDLQIIHFQLERFQ